MNILVINAGSSSLKYQLLNPETGVLLAKGLCERIGIDGKFTYKPQIEGKQILDAVDVAMPTHSEAIQAVLNALVDKDNGVIGSMQEIDAVGHRVGHAIFVTRRGRLVNRFDHSCQFISVSKQKIREHCIFPAASPWDAGARQASAKAPGQHRRRRRRWHRI